MRPLTILKCFGHSMVLAFVGQGLPSYNTLPENS